MVVELFLPMAESYGALSIDVGKIYRRWKDLSWWQGSTLEATIRHYLGEDLESMSLEELQNLEQQRDNALKHIQSIKNQLMYESLNHLQRKEKEIHEENNMLAKQIQRFLVSRGVSVRKRGLVHNLFCGTLDKERTDMLDDNVSARVAFLDVADGEKAFESSQDKCPFGYISTVKYRLNSSILMREQKRRKMKLRLQRRQWRWNI